MPSHMHGHAETDAGSHVGAVGRVEFADVGAVDWLHDDASARPVLRKMVTCAVGDRAQ